MFTDVIPLTFVLVFAFSKSIEFVAIITFTGVSSIQVNTVTVTTYTSHKTFVDVFTCLLIPGLHVSFMTITVETTTTEDVCAHTMTTVSRSITFVQVHTLATVHSIQMHTFFTTAVEPSLKVVTDACYTWIFALAFVNVCTSFLSIDSLLLVSRITFTSVSHHRVDALSFTALLR
jgi:hypothetical protein